MFFQVKSPKCEAIVRIVLGNAIRTVLLTFMQTERPQTHISVEIARLFARVNFQAILTVCAEDD